MVELRLQYEIFIDYTRNQLVPFPVIATAKVYKVYYDNVIICQIQYLRNHDLNCYIYAIKLQLLFPTC